MRLPIIAAVALLLLAGVGAAYLMGLPAHWAVPFAAVVLIVWIVVTA